MRGALRVALAAVAAVCACSTDQAAPELDDMDIISYNSLAPAALIDNGDALEELAGAALDGAETELVDSEAGRSLLSYVVRCALGATGSAAFPRASGPDLVYTGLLGFAPSWEDSPLEETKQRFMTGCLMAHVNAFGTRFPISVRSSALGTPLLTERLLFPAQELAVYGNYFAAPSERSLHVCFGQAVAQSLGGGGLGGALGLPTYLDFRVCSVSDDCGFNRVGACYRWPSVPSVTTSACEVQSGDLYTHCHEAPFQQQTTPAWDETVSVYVQPGDLALLLAEYVELL